eukprot:5770571-Pleurochrysis_carterae.AAC.1
MMRSCENLKGGLTKLAEELEARCRRFCGSRDAPFSLPFLADGKACSARRLEREDSLHAFAASKLCGSCTFAYVCALAAPAPAHLCPECQAGGSSPTRRTTRMQGSEPNYISTYTLTYTLPLI